MHGNVIYAAAYTYVILAYLVATYYDSAIQHIK